MSTEQSTAIVPAPEQVFNKKRRSKRPGVPSSQEQALVSKFVQDLGAPATPGQIQQLAALLRRSEAAVKTMMERARDQFAAASQTYVDTHLLATTGALAKGDYETAGKLAQWAIENLGAEGVRIVEKKGAGSEGPSGPKIVVGVQLGGLGTLPNQVSIQAPVVEAEVVKA